MIFRKSQALGLSISDANIVALELSGTLKKVVLQAVNRKKIPPGLVQDGEILKQEELARAIQDLLLTPRKGTFTTREVIFALPESKTFPHIFRVPANLSQEELIRKVAEEAMRTLPFPQGALYADFVPIGKNGDWQDMLYVAAEKRILDGFLETLNRAGLKPIACDMESIALARSFIREYHKDGATMIVDIGARTTNVSIFDTGLMRLSATIPIAGMAFTEAIAGRLSVSIEEAEDRKLQFGIAATPDGKRILEVLEPLLESIVERIKETQDHYERESGRKVQEIIMAGGSSLLSGLEDWLHKRLAVPVRKGAAESPVLFATALGLAKRGLAQDERTTINLLPKK